MPRRWAPKTKALIHSLLLDRDGPLCSLCHTDPTEPLQIDHIDPTGPDHAKNLRLLCPSCNLGRRRSPDRGILRERERDDTSSRQLSLDDVPPPSPTISAKKAIPYAEGSVEMRAATWFEPTYRAWITSNVPIPKSEAINGGAEAAGCSPETAARYLAKMTSKAGPLTQEPDIHGVITIRSKKESQQ